MYRQKSWHSCRANNFWFKNGSTKHTEMNRNLTRLKTASEEIRVGAISGAVGNYSSIDPKV